MDNVEKQYPVSSALNPFFLLQLLQHLKELVSHCVTVVCGY